MNRHTLVLILAALLLTGLGASPLAAQDDPPAAPYVSAAWNPVLPDLIAVVVADDTTTELRLLDTSGTVISTTPLEGVGVSSAPVWNVTGTHLAFSISTTEGYDVALIDATDPAAPVRLAFSTPRGQIPVFWWASVFGLAVANEGQNEGQIEYWAFWDKLQLNPIEYNIQVGSEPPAIEALAYSRDSTYLAVAHADEVAVWFISEGGNFGVVGRIPTLAPDAPTSATLAWSPDSRRVVVGDLYSQQVYAVDFLNPPVLEVSLAGLDGKTATHLQWRADRLAAVFFPIDDSADTATIQIWDTPTWATLFTQDISTRQADVVSLNGEGDRLLTGVDPATNALTIVALDAPAVATLLTNQGQMTGPTTATAACANDAARVAVLMALVPNTPYELSMLIESDNAVYLSLRTTFFSSAAVVEPATFVLAYSHPPSQGEIPTIPATSEAGSDLPVPSAWAFQVRRTDTNTCQSIAIAVDCSTGSAIVTDNTAACLLP